MPNADFFELQGIKFRKEIPNTKANYWLMALELENKEDRDTFLKNNECCRCND